MNNVGGEGREEWGEGGGEIWMNERMKTYVTNAFLFYFYISFATT